MSAIAEDTGASFCVPVCVRDGEQLATIQVAGIEFQMGITELRNLIGCAKMDMANASEPIRRVFEPFLAVAITVCDLAASLSPQVDGADMEANRERWAQTGIGGVQKLGPLIRKVSELRAATQVDWAGQRAEFAERGQRLFT